MNANEGIKVTGRLKWELIRDGEVVQSGERDNIVTTVGRNALASLLNSSSVGNTFVTHMGFGTGTTAVNQNDTALQTELTIGTAGYNRVAITAGNRTNPTANSVRYQATLSGVTSNPTIQEAGLFNNATGGTLIAHQLTGAVTLSSSADSLQITWDLTFS